jgi:hypothetical protein
LQPGVVDGLPYCGDGVCGVGVLVEGLLDGALDACAGC